MENVHTGVAEAVNDHSGGTKEIWRTFWILLVLTIVELIMGYILIGVENRGLRMLLKGAIIILMLSKAFYIVAYFMHLKSEIRNLVMTIIVPLALLVWAIIAFLYDGNSFKNDRNTYDPYKRERSHIKSTDVKADEKGKPGEKRTGAME